MTQPTPLHQLLAQLPLEAPRTDAIRSRHQLVITTNYDDILERAFREAGEPYEVVVYMAAVWTAATSSTWRPTASGG